jgi:hypothetical protein
MMVALDRGGAAGKTPNFCCCCDKNNETRGNVIFDNGEEVIEFGINDYAQLKQKFEKFPNLNYFKPDKSNTEFTNWVGPNAIPGFLPELCVPCTMHAEMRFVNNLLFYHLNYINYSGIPRDQKVAMFKNFEDFMNHKIYGTIIDPGAWALRLFTGTLAPKKLSFKHGICTKLLNNIDDLLSVIEFPEFRTLSKTIWNEFKLGTDIWNIGIRCARRGDNHVCSEEDQDQNGNGNSNANANANANQEEIDSGYNNVDENNLDNESNFAEQPQEDDTFWTLSEMFRDSEMSINSSTPNATGSTNLTTLSATNPTTNPTTPNSSPETNRRRNKRNFQVCEPDPKLKAEEILMMQNHLDRCFVAFVMRFGPNKVFNYMHFLGAGHFAVFARKLGNLAVYNQQAFESRQGVDQTFVLHSTQRGGRIGRMKSRTNPMLDLIRRLLRKVGIGVIKKKKEEDRGRHFYQARKEVRWVLKS